MARTEGDTKTLSRLAFVIFGFIAFWYAAGVVAAAVWGLGIEGFDVIMLPFPLVGFFIAWHRPRNAIGWIMLGIGVTAALGIAFGGYASYGLEVDPGSLPRPDVALLLTQPLWIPQIVPIGTFLILLFPDGRLPSPGWRKWAWLCIVAMVLPFIGILISPGSFAESGFPQIDNPIGIDALGPYMGVLFVIILLIPISIVGCAVSLIRRFRRSRGQQRQQLKWLAAAGGLVAVVYLLLIFLRLPFEVLHRPVPRWIDAFGSFGILLFCLIPFAIAVAVFRYRLYDVDRIINRTLVYGALTGVLGASYAAIVAVAGTVLKGSAFITAGATLAVAALFQPLRRRIQAFIDKRFYRRKYDAVRAVEAFSGRLRQEVDLEAMRDELLAATRETVQPQRASVWLRG